MDSESERKNDQYEQSQARGGRNRYERLTNDQKRKLEEHFAQNQHPDEIERIQIAEEIGIDPIRVKFWFQNKRSQNKNKEIKTVNHDLLVELEMLRARTREYEAARCSGVCPNCNWPAADFQNLALFNQPRTLRLPINNPDHAAAGPSMVNNIPPCLNPQPPVMMMPSNSSCSNSPTLMNDTQAVLLSIAESAAEELYIMAQSGEPLWLQCGPHHQNDISMEMETLLVLNEQEYALKACKWASPYTADGLKREATRAVAMINMDIDYLIETFCNAKKWSAMFYGIVLRATEMCFMEGNDYNGTLRMMRAEYQLPSPVVPTRESEFMRYCKQLPTEKSWIVVDFTLEASHATVNRCHRRPSGCLIRKMKDTLKVTWIEHVEVGDTSVNDIYKPVINSGIAFGAKRWLTALSHQSARIASVVTCNNPKSCVEGKEGQIMTQINVMKVSERMVLCFQAGTVGSIADGWVHEHGTGLDEVRILSKRNQSDPGLPFGITVSASISFRLPIPPKAMFDFLSDEMFRGKWDCLSESGTLVEGPQILAGAERSNCISVFRLNENKRMMFIQESYFGDACSHVVYAPVSSKDMNMCLYRGDPGKIHLLPSGFSLVPDAPSRMAMGTLLTASFQILADANSHSNLTRESVEAVSSLVTSVVNNLKNELLGNNT